MQQYLLFTLLYFQGGKVPMLQSPLGVMMGYSNDSPFTSPPPAHMGIPPVTIDPKTGTYELKQMFVFIRHTIT